MKMLRERERGADEAVRITRPAAAAALGHPNLRRIVLTCTRREMSLSQMARAFRAPLSTLHAQTSKLLRLGLLRVARMQKRGGRSIRFFRATGSAFIVPTHAMPVSPSAAYEDELRESLARIERLQDQQISFTTDAEGRPRMERVRGDQSRNAAALELWCSLSLRASDISSLRHDLVALTSKYLNRRDEAGVQSILLHVAFAPRLARQRRSL